MAIQNENGSYIGSPEIGDVGYEYDYYSGSQVNIMIGDVLIDTAQRIQFNVQQSKTPIYGYASQYYSFVSDGKVFVQGNIVINFKEAGYLFWPMQRFLSRKAKAGGELPPNQTNTTPRYHERNGNVNNKFTYNDADGADSKLLQMAEYGRAANGARTQKANVEQMMQWSNKRPLPAKSQYNKFVKNLGSLDDSQFEDWSETFQDVIWYGTDANHPDERDSFNSNNLTLGDFSESDPDSKEMNDVILTHRRADQYPEIDIWITYGNTNKRSANFTVKKLLDVSFTSVHQDIGPNGQPVAEVYQFIAKNVV